MKYKRRVDFKKGSPSAYATAGSKRWLKEICRHMETRQKYPPGYWTEERCAEEALKYKTPERFKRGSPSAYTMLQKSGLLDKYCVHMTKVESKPDGYWENKENSRMEASKFKTRSEFSKYSSWGAHVARKNGWLDEFFPKKRS